MPGQPPRVSGSPAALAVSSRNAAHHSPDSGSGLAPAETEFLANIVLPDNTTAGEWMLPQIEHAYRTGKMPPLPPA